MAEEGEGEGEEEGEGKLPCVDHGPLNKGAVGKMFINLSTQSCQPRTMLRFELGRQLWVPMFVLGR